MTGLDIELEKEWPHERNKIYVFDKWSRYFVAILLLLNFVVLKYFGYIRKHFDIWK